MLELQKIHNHTPLGKQGALSSPTGNRHGRFTRNGACWFSRTLNSLALCTLLVGLEGDRMRTLSETEYASGDGLGGDQCAHLVHAPSIHSTAAIPIVL